MPPVVFTTGFFIAMRQLTYERSWIFSKRPVKTYPHLKIKFRGITFEQLTVTDYSHEMNPAFAATIVWP
jgi:hypothetical protein